MSKLVCNSFTHSVGVLDANFVGTLRLAESARWYVLDLKEFVSAFTVGIYGFNYPNNVSNESIQLRPNRTYAGAKDASELYLEQLKIC